MTPPFGGSRREGLWSDGLQAIYCPQALLQPKEDHNMRYSHWLRITAFSIAGVIIAGCSFYAARQWSNDPVVQAELPPGPQSDAEVTPLPTPSSGDGIDTSRAGWGLAYLAADKELPRFDQRINGIAVGPTSSHASAGLCEQGAAQWVSAAAANGTPLAVNPDWLPNGAVTGDAKAVRCGAAIVHTEAAFEIPPAPDLASRVQSGESWFDLQHGGQIFIYRDHVAAPGFESSIASERWEPGNINRLPAAIGRPVLRSEFGESAVVVWDAERGMQTVVRGFDVELTDLVALAEELTK